MKTISSTFRTVSFSVFVLAGLVVLAPQYTVAQWTNAGQINGVQVWRDNTTGLEWTVSLSRTATHGQAQQRVANLGFRLPTINEYRQLLNNGGIQKLSIDTRLNSGFYWEATGGKVNGNGGNFNTLFPPNHLTIGAPYAIGVRKSGTDAKQDNGQQGGNRKFISLP
jgi:hypothetical protein